MEGKSYLLCCFASGHLLLNEAMEGYILIVLQVLITRLIIWRRKQDSKEPLGCLAAGLYGSDYQAAPPEAWIKKFRRTTPSPVFIVFALMLILINWLVWKSAKQDDTQRRRDGSRIGLAGDPKPLYCTHPARTVLAGTGVARHSWYCLLVFRHTETKDPQAQPDMSEMQPGNPPGDSFARIGKGYETAD